ncbi:MAG: hypothetical protein ACSLE2_20005, partial [Lysobacterales bacterium]
MLTTSCAISHSSVARSTFTILVLTFLLSVTLSAPAAELSVEYDVIARSGVTPIPGGAGTFTGFGDKPAIDADGNVVFTAGGGATGNQSFQSGVYTFLGVCCQRVADRTTLVPGGGGATFDVFRGADRNDIDEGRVAFTADVSASGTLLGVYSNVGQASASNLVKVALADGNEWSIVSDPWVDNGVVALRGRRLVPSQHDTILLWDGANSFVDPGVGYIVSPGTVASTSADQTIFRRYKSGSSQLGVYDNGFYEVLVTLNSTLVPGHGSMTFSNVNNFPVVDRGGLDVAFRGNGSGSLVGLYKRVDGGALEQVVDTTTVVPGALPIPGAGDQVFSFFGEDSTALAEGQVVFWADGRNNLEGIYTDIGGELAVLLDNEANSVLLLDGVPQQVTRLAMSHKALAWTPWGDMLAFKATLSTGETAIIRATITEGPGTGTGTFTVRKDFSDNNTANVSITASCSSGTVTNNPQLAREGVPAVFTISGASAGATCTATEPSVPTGYTRNQTDCQNGDPLNGSCTIVNTKNTTTTNSFTVRKDFSDNNTASVSVTLTCTSGTVTNNPRLASESSPAVFSISGAATGATCTATEPSVPSGYTRNQTDCQNGDPLNGSCTIINTRNTTTANSFTVYKDFSDNNSAIVSITASCSSGTVTNNPQPAREGKPAVFAISGATTGTTCTATEPTVPPGYTRNQADCQNGDPLNGSCTIINTRNTTTADSFRVYKDFSDNNTASVSITASCSSGTVTNNPQLAREGVPAVFTVTGASAGATCTATEPTVPTGYTRNQTDCQNGDPLNTSCFIVNTKNTTTTNSFTVRKDFSDNNTASVSVTLTCTSGTVTNNPRLASESS